MIKSLLYVLKFSPTFYIDNGSEAIISNLKDKCTKVVDLNQCKTECKNNYKVHSQSGYQMFEKVKRMNNQNYFQIQ